MKINSEQKQEQIELRKSAILKELKWAKPMGLGVLAKIFDVHPNTMRKLLKGENPGEKPTVPNKKVSRNLWRVPLEELPAEYVAKVLFGLD